MDAARGASDRSLKLHLRLGLAALAAAMLCLSTTARAQRPWGPPQPYPQPGYAAPSYPAPYVPPPAPDPPPSPGGFAGWLDVGLGGTARFADAARRGVDPGFGGALTMNGLLAGFSKGVTWRGSYGLFLGGSADGLQGGGNVVLAAGPGIPVSQHAQLYGRMGLASVGAFSGEANRSGMLLLPDVALGFQYWGLHAGFDVGPRTGLSLVSNAHVFGDERSFGPRPVLGGGATFANAIGLVDVMAVRAFDGSPIDLVDGRACLRPILFTSICGFGHVARARMPGAGPDIAWAMAGISLGVSYVPVHDEISSLKSLSRPPR